mgnify:FL=1
MTSLRLSSCFGLLTTLLLFWRSPDSGATGIHCLPILRLTSFDLQLLYNCLHIVSNPFSGLSKVYSFFNTPEGEVDVQANKNSFVVLFSFQKKIYRFALVNQWVAMYRWSFDHRLLRISGVSSFVLHLLRDFCSKTFFKEPNLPVSSFPHLPVGFCFLSDPTRKQR